MNILLSRRPVNAEGVHAAIEIDRARREPVTLRALAALESPYEGLHLQALEQFGGIPDARVTEALLPAAGSESSVDASLRSFAAERFWEHAADLRFADSDSVAVLKDLLTDSDPSGAWPLRPWIMEAITGPNKRGRGAVVHHLSWCMTAPCSPKGLPSKSWGRSTPQSNR